MDKIPASIISVLAWGGAIGWLGTIVVFTISNANFERAAILGNTLGEIFNVIFIYPILASVTPFGFASLIIMIVGFVVRGNHPEFKD